MKKNLLPGFSLIELLVVIAVSLVLLGGAISALVSFSERRSVTNAVDELKTIIQTAQSKTQSGDLGSCSQLIGYQLQTYLNGNFTEVSLQEVCETGTAGAAQIQTLPDGVTVSPNLDALFLVLNAGVELPSAAASQDISVNNDQHEYIFTLYREGRVSEGVWQ